MIHILKNHPLFFKKKKSLAFWFYNHLELNSFLSLVQPTGKCKKILIDGQEESFLPKETVDPENTPLSSQMLLVLILYIFCGSFFFFFTELSYKLNFPDMVLS